MHALSFVAIILWCVGVATGCHSFKDTNVTVVTNTSATYSVVVTGCLERKVFKDTIVEIHVEHQPVPNLERDAIRHLVKLQEISFSECGLETVSVDVFRNVGRLRVVRMVKNLLKEIERDVFSTLEMLEVLDLSRNRIIQMESGAFGNSSTLKEVDLAFNELEFWSREWFQGSTNIEVVNFQNNNIKVLPRRALYDFQQLRNVSFDYNQLELIHPEAFSGISRLDYLGLRYNRLTTLNPRSFPNSLHVKLMAIDANYLNFLSYALMANLEVKELVLIGNPWKCPCLDQIHHWLFESESTVRDSEFCKAEDIPVCSYPSTYSHTCRESVDDEVTRSYLRNLKMRTPKLDQFCARLDRVNWQVT